MAIEIVRNKVVFKCCDCKASSNGYNWELSCLRSIPESLKVCRLMVTSEMSYDSVVLTKDTRVIRGFPTDSDQFKTKEN